MTDQLQNATTIKLRLDEQLVRQLDAMVLTSDGALRDRSAAVAMLIAQAPDALAPKQPSEDDLRVNEFDWQLPDQVPTLPAIPAAAADYAMHNADGPTLWAVHELARRCADTGGPVDFERWRCQLVADSWTRGRHLALHGLRAGQTLALGFPANRERKANTQRRLIEHFLAAVQPARGPLVTWGLIGVHQKHDGSFVAAPTPQALELLRDLPDPALRPAGADAWQVWWRYLLAAAPEEARAWLVYLQAVAERPTRAELMEQLRAFTDVAAAGRKKTPDTKSRRSQLALLLTSRSREWGIIKADLDGLGRYELVEGFELPTVDSEDLEGLSA